MKQYDILWMLVGVLGVLIFPAMSLAGAPEAETTEVFFHRLEHIESEG